MRASQAVALYATGKSLDQTGAELGCSGTYIRRLLLKQGVERREKGPKRKPMFEIVMMRAQGHCLQDIAGVFGVGKANICLRLARIGARGDLSRLVSLSPIQKAAYREALDVDRLTHPDALEVALEYGAGEAA